MNIEETIESLEYLIGGDCCDTQMDYIEEIKLAIQALEKQVAKKPIKTKGYYECPSCGDCPTYNDKYDDITRNDCCQYCGQKLDWGKE